MAFMRFAACALALIFSSGLTASAGTVSGTATFLERIMPPPDARFVAILADISLADAPEVELGRVEIEDAGGPPYAFAINYDPAAIDQKHTYAVRATLWAGDVMMFTTDTIMPVLTNGAPDEVSIIMRRVGTEQPQNEAQDAETAPHQLQLPASFTGQLPCADCDAIAYHLDLWPEYGFHLRREWLGRSDEAGANRQDAVGSWYHDAEQNVIVLPDLSDTSMQWQIDGPDRISLVDPDGEASDPALPYELTSDGTLNETDIEDVLLGGMMIYMADAAVFEECATGRRYPIVADGDYLALERAYLADQSGPGEPLYVNVEGALLMRPAMEGPDQRSLVVERFIRTRPGTTCENQRANASLINTYWRIDTLAGEPVTGLPIDGREPHLILNDSDGERFSATVGCNMMVGGYTLQDSNLSFGQVAGTLMACLSPLDSFERSLAQTLGAVQSYRISGETLALFDEANTVIALMTAIYLQ